MGLGRVKWSVLGLGCDGYLELSPRAIAVHGMVD